MVILVLFFLLFVHDLLISTQRVADCQKELGNYHTALSGYKQTLYLNQQIQQQSGLDQSTLRQHYVSLSHIADFCLRSTGNIPEALINYEQSLAVSRQLKQQQSGYDFTTLRDISVTIGKIANCYQENGEYQIALTGYQDSIAICEKLQQHFETHRKYWRDIYVNTIKIADCNRALENITETISGYEKV